MCISVLTDVVFQPLGYAVCSQTDLFSGDVSNEEGENFSQSDYFIVFELL